MHWRFFWLGSCPDKLAHPTNQSQLASQIVQRSAIQLFLSCTSGCGTSSTSIGWHGSCVAAEQFCPAPWLAQRICTSSATQVRFCISAAHTIPQLAEAERVAPIVVQWFVMVLAKQIAFPAKRAVRARRFRPLQRLPLWGSSSGPN